MPFAGALSVVWTTDRIRDINYYPVAKVMNVNALIKTLVLWLVVSVAIYLPAQEQEKVNPLVQQGIELFQRKKVEEAIATIEKAIEQNPNDALAHNALGVIYSQKGEFDKALEYFDKAISLKDDYFKAIYNKFNLLISNRKIEEATALIENLTKQHPDHADGWINYAMLTAGAGKREEAMGYLDKAIQINPKDFDAMVKKGQLYLLDQDYEKALECFNSALEIAPGFVPAEEFARVTKDIMDKKAQGYIRVRQILLPNRELAERIKGEISNGSDFAVLAARHSIDASKKHGGDLGFVKKGELIAAIENVIFALEVGQVSDIILTPRGFHIFKREE